MSRDSPHSWHHCAPTGAPGAPGNTCPQRGHCSTRGHTKGGPVGVGTLRPAAGPKEPRLRAPVGISTHTSAGSCTGRSAAGVGDGAAVPSAVRLLPSTRQKGRALSKRTISPQGQSAQRRGRRRQRPPAKSQPHSKGQPVRRGSARGDTHLGTGKAQAHSQLKQVLVFLPSLNPLRD